MKKIKNILLIGPQGSGKDTQSEMLARKRKVPFIVMGDLFRREIEKKSRLGNLLANLMNKGILVSDKITFAILKNRLRKNDALKGFILNGFPRNLKQAKMLGKLVKIDLVIELWISDKESLRRLAGRRFCPGCSATYHLFYKKPKEKNICDKCGHSLITRKDDKIPVIKKRLGIYHRQTEPIFRYYKKNSRYLKTNGEQPIKRVFLDIGREIKNLAK
ncbi:MAG: nucleoside monophosphate kinase [Patescibacteria group bacterium]